MNRFRTLLTCAGLMSFAGSLFQALLACSPSWCASWGAPGELLANPLLLLVAGLGVSGLLAIFGLYGLSGAGRVRRLPLLRLGLLGIGLGYSLMGVVSLVPQLLVWTGVVDVSVPQLILLRNIVFFSAVLLTGLLYLAGLAAGWKRLSAGMPEGPKIVGSEQENPIARV